MKVIERVRENAVKTRVMRIDELDRLNRQLRKATERNMKAFDEGFGAAVQMVERGADLKQLKSACGVVAAEWQDTDATSVPYEIMAEDTIPMVHVNW